MDSHSSTGTALRPSSAPPTTSQPLPISRRDDVEPVRRIVNAVVATAFALELRQLETAGHHPLRQTTLAYQVAMYLAHVGFGISMARIAQAFGRHRTTVTHACHLVEDRRDDPRFDRLLECLEEAASALRTAYDIYQHRREVSHGRPTG